MKITRNYAKSILIMILCLIMAISMSVLMMGCNSDTSEDNLLTEATTYGEFFPLETAYNDGLISKEYVRDIGYYFNDGKEWVSCQCGSCDSSDDGLKKWECFVETDYTPTVTLSGLETTTAEQIQSDLCALMNQESSISYDIDDIEITNYYGTYDGYVAVAFKTQLVDSFNEITTQTIADTVFYYTNTFSAVVLWKAI